MIGLVISLPDSFKKGAKIYRDLKELGLLKLWLLSFALARKL